MAFSQENNSDLSKTFKRMNSADITIGGTGLFIFANYSRVIAVKSNYFINASVGVGKAMHQLLPKLCILITYPR